MIIKRSRKESEIRLDELIDVIGAFNRATEDYWNDFSVIYPPEAERLTELFGKQKRWAKFWEQPNNCMYQGCKRKSIGRSHSVPMSGSIKLISEAGHVVTPRYGEKGLSMERIGIRKASTFPGFCHHHESIFADFESKKSISSVRHYLLQAFRSLCREIFRMRAHKERLQTVLEEYRTLRRDFFISRLDGVGAAAHNQPREVTFKGDSREQRAADAVDSLSEGLVELEQMYRDLLHEIETGAHDPPLVPFKLDLRLPVCLSGTGSFNYMDGENVKKALCILVVVPEKQATKATICCARKHINTLMPYRRLESQLQFLEILESWMCHGSDHWFMTPSEWNAIPEGRKKLILDAILNDEFSIAHTFEHSILDSARKHVLNVLERALAQGKYPNDQVPEVRQLLASERRKLDDY